MKDLISSFIDEARAAPSLFMDLAKVELYISESYRTRALIELIQNADDSGATDFVAYQHKQNLIVANNGKFFDEADILALCRSGSSTKKRGAGTIGYRGIGFKSTVGICNEIEVHSGSYSFLFSQSLTKKIINTEEDVPLIRIPHLVDTHYSLPAEIQELNYNTIFIFKNVNFRIINEEINSLDISSCIFTNHIRNITLKSSSLKKHLIMEVSDSNKTVKSAEREETWIVFDNPEDTNNCKVAMKIESDEIQSSNKDEALIHAFLPTKESPGAALKFNGDFSTDPSRKFVDFDEKSEKSYFACCQILASSIQTAINKNLYRGIFKVFAGSNSGNKNKLRESLSKALNGGLHFRGSFFRLQDVRTCPDWLSYTDYLNLKSTKNLIYQDLVEEYPEILDFLSWMGVKAFTSSEILFDTDFGGISHHGMMSLIGNYAKKNRFTLESNDLSKLKKLNIIPYNDNMVSPEYILNSSIKLPKSTLDTIQMAELESDIKSLFKSLNLIDITNYKKFNFQSKLIDSNKNKSLTKSSNIKKWRSAELNLKEYLSQFNSILKVTDVSKAHVGYDLKVQQKSGKILHIEVKSVKNLNSDFEITNNEFAVASDLEESYFIALVVESESDFDIRLIQNPIKTLDFEKRIKVTSWVCDSYNDKMKFIKDIL